MVNPVELRTTRLLLRPFTMDDVEDVLGYNNDPEWAEYQVNIPPVPFTRKDAETLVAMFSDPSYWETGHPGLPSTGNGAGLLQIFAVVFEGKVIGEIALNQRDEDRPNERVELAYTLSRQHWGNGLMTEAARAVMNWAFQTYSFNRLFAWCDPRNIGSWRVLEKLGMKREGQLRSHMKWNGEFRDQLYYGILRGEWKADPPGP
ncbi:GNAT family N-acetyltransferase [Chloroflexota bacterium]